MTRINAADRTPSELAEFAAGLARETASRIIAKRDELLGSHKGADMREYTMTKSSEVDPVTVVDTLAEDFIADAIEQAFPGDGIIGEEGASRDSITGISWVVDPIDGTVNFLYGIPQFAVSIAAAREGEVVAGVVINVATGELYSASLGDGATVTREGAVPRALAVRKEDELNRALVATGFSYSASRRAEQAAIVAKLLYQVRDIRRMGSAALDLCALAEGRIDGYYEHGLNCWDFAAGRLIASEAGAVVATPRLSTPGVAGELVFAAEPGIADQLRDALRECGGSGPLPR